MASHGIEPIIPYPANQNPEEPEYLRVDKRFRAHGPERLKGLRNIATHVLLCIIAMLLTALTAIRLGKTEQIRAITSLTRN